MARMRCDALYSQEPRGSCQMEWVEGMDGGTCGQENRNGKRNRGASAALHRTMLSQFINLCWMPLAPEHSAQTVCCALFQHCDSHNKLCSFSVATLYSPLNLLWLDDDGRVIFERIGGSSRFGAPTEHFIRPFIILQSSSLSWQWVADYVRAETTGNRATTFLYVTGNVNIGWGRESEDTFPKLIFSLFVQKGEEGWTTLLTANKRCLL